MNMFILLHLQTTPTFLIIHLPGHFREMVKKKKRY